MLDCCPACADGACDECLCHELAEAYKTSRFGQWRCPHCHAGGTMIRVNGWMWCEHCNNPCREPVMA